MSLEAEFEQLLLHNYQTCGEELGYWASYFLREVKLKGGLATAQRLLRPGRPSAQPAKGFQTLIDAGRTDLSIEEAVLDNRFRRLFAAAELAEARRRLDSLPAYVRRRTVEAEDNHAGEVGDEEYVEGTVRSVKVNQFERDRKARDACIKKHGLSCAVCKMSFYKTYGSIGKRFIHIHHKKPLALRRTAYKVNPRTDLVPVCPNCHAMLHTSSPPLGVDELRNIIKDQCSVA